MQEEEVPVWWWPVTAFAAGIPVFTVLGFIGIHQLNSLGERASPQWGEWEIIYKIDESVRKTIMWGDIHDLFSRLSDAATWAGRTCEIIDYRLLRERPREPLRQGLETHTPQITSARESSNKLLTFEELKRSGFFYIPYENIDVGIRDFVRKINELPYAVTVGSCEGHTYEELLRRPLERWTPDLLKTEYPQGYAPAYVTLYVTSNRRLDFWNWLKNVVDMEQVTIHMEPVKENRFERWEPTRRIEYTRDKVFEVYITSKKLHMPFSVCTALKTEGVEKAVAEKWLKEDLPRITYFLEVRPVEVILKPDWLRSKYYPRIIYLGLKRIENRDKFRKMLIHECLHAKGVLHSREARELGYSSVQVEDILSEKVRDWIFYGKPKPPELDFLLKL